MHARIISLILLVLSVVQTAQSANDSYLAWATAKWGVSVVGSSSARASIWGENADPDGDGLPNLLEYATGTDPTRPNPPSDCYQYTPPDTGALSTRFPQLRAWLRTDDPDLRVTCQTSSDLVSWLPSVSLDFTQPAPLNSYVWSQETGSLLRGLRQMQYVDTQSMAQRPAAFMRLSVSRRGSSVTSPAVDPFTFTSGQAAPGSTARSSAITLSGFTGSTTISIPAGVTLYVNGVAQTGSSATVKAGDSLWMQATAPGTAGVPRNYSLTIGGQSATWTFTTAAVAAVSDHTGTDSGYTPVETGVSDTGAAQISIPIVVSPGTAGMQPKLSINYSSQGGNGPLGVGFSLSGLSSISRVGRTVAQDGVKGGVNFDANDRFALDGQRLIAINGADGADGTEYRLEFDPTSRIRSYGAVGNGPEYWIVETKAGLKMEFGSNGDAQINPEGGLSILAWGIKYIYDTTGTNTMKFFYDGSARAHGEMLLTNISYSREGPSNQEVICEYEDRPDVRTSYVGGHAIRSTKRVIAIESRGTENGVMKRVRRYALSYQPGELTNASRLTQVTESTWDGTQLSPTVIDWDTNGARGFNNGMTLSTDPAFLGTTWNSQYEPFSSSPPSRIVTGDFNGDGLMDVVHMNDHTASYLPYSQYIAFGKPGGGFNFISGLVGLLSKTMVSADSSRLRVGDFDGDGKSDLLHILNTGTDNWVALSNGDGSFNLRQGQAQIGAIASQTMQPTFASDLVTVDVNGDGKTDVVYLETGKMAVYLSNGDGSFTKASNTGLENLRVEERTAYGNWGWIIPGDFNGDGKADILYAYRQKDTASPPHESWLALSNGDGTFTVLHQSQMTGFDGLTWDNANPQLVSGDFNGDGLTDVMQMSPPSRGPVWVALSKGDGTFEVSTPAPPLGGFNLSAQSYTHMQSADLNGDGFDDIFNADAYNTNSFTFVALSNGDGTFQFLQGAALGALSGITYSTGDSSRILIGDFDGDGALDIFHLQRNHNHYLSRLNGFERNRVAKVTNGHGGYTTFGYKPLTDSTVYTKGSGLTYPCYDLQASMYVVSSLTSRNGIDGDAFTGAGAGTPGENTATYHYEGTWSCLDGRGFQGFKAVERTDATAGIVSRTEYESSTPLLGGHVKHTEQRLLLANVPANGSALISESDTTWNIATKTNAGYPNTYFVTEASSTSKAYEVNRPAATALVTTTTRSGFSYDDYGNLLTSATTTTGPETFTESVTNTYTDAPTPTKWHLGRLATSTVTKTGPNPAGAGTVSLTRSSSFAYNPTTGLLTQEVIEPSGGTLRQQKDYTHDGFGNILTSTLTVTGEPSRKTTTTYTPDGRFVATTTNALNHTESKTYDPLLGNVLTQTGPNGLTTSWDYDAIGRPIQENRPDGTVTRSFYRRVTGSTEGAPPRAVHYVRVQSSGGSPKTVWYDLLDREIRTDGIGFDGRTVSSHKVFNERGQVTRASQPYFASDTPLYSQMFYDAVGREYQQTDPGNRITTTAYNGLTTTVTNPKNQTVSSTVNAMGWTVQSSQYLGTAAKTITRKYDPYGNLRFVTDPANNTTELRYDVRGNKTYMSEPNSGSSSFTYNGFGELKTQTNAASQTVSLTYDKLGRMLTRTEPEGVTTFEYDSAAKGIGQLASESSGDFVRSYFYDHLGRPVGTVESHGFHTFAVSRSYDAYGRPDTMTYPTGFATRQVYTARGYLSQVRNAATGGLYWAAHELNARGQITQEQAGNSVATGRAFDPETGLIQSIRSGLTPPAPNPGISLGDYDPNQPSPYPSIGTETQKAEFDFDLIGNLTARRDVRFASTFEESFTYDSLNRLKTVDTTGGTPVIASYNDIGNLTGRSDVGTFNYARTGNAGPHALTSVTSVIPGMAKTCATDVKGNRTTDGATSLTYSSFNKPVRMVKGDDTLRFDYGPDRALYRQTTFLTQTGGATSQTVREYIGGLYERETTSEGLVRHIHYIAGGSGVAAIFTDERSASTTAQRTRYIHKDHLGSVDVITDSAGAVVERQSFDAWGRRRTVAYNSGTSTWSVTYPATPGSAETHRGFTGHEMLDAVGLVHMGGRIYDPITARFLSPDPFVQSPDNLQNLNRYSYVLNNPLSFTDPSGFFHLGKFLKKTIGLGFLSNLLGDKTWNMVAAIGIGVATGNVFAAYGAFAAGAGYGFGSAFSGTLLAGGSVGDALRAGLRAGAISGASAGLTDAAATRFGLHDLKIGDAEFSSKLATKIAVHGVIQGGVSELQGGKFVHGFLAGAASGGASPFIADANLGLAGETAAAAVVGGTASVLGGGKFGNGAVSGAFVYLFNEAGNRLRSANSGAAFKELAKELSDSTCPSSRGDFIDSYGASALHRSDGFTNLFTCGSWSSCDPIQIWVTDTSSGLECAYDSRTGAYIPGRATYNIVNPEEPVTFVFKGISMFGYQIAAPAVIGESTIPSAIQHNLSDTPRKFGIHPSQF